MTIEEAAIARAKARLEAWAKEHEEGKGHEAALQKLREDIEEQKKQSVQA